MRNAARIARIATICMVLLLIAAHLVFSRYTFEYLSGVNRNRRVIKWRILVEDCSISIRENVFIRGWMGSMKTDNANFYKTQRIYQLFGNWHQNSPFPKHWEQRSLSQLAREYGLLRPIYQNSKLEDRIVWVNSNPGLYLKIPFWLVAIPFVVTYSVLFLAKRRRRPFCTCGYSPIGNVSGICPECGKPIKVHSITS